MVCTCRNDRKWYIPGSLRHSTELLNKYVQQRLQIAQVSTTHSLSLDYLKESVKHECVVPPEVVDRLNYFKDYLTENHPLKVCECRAPTRCCGSCAKECKTRCVQDLLQRLYFELIWGDDMIKDEVQYVLTKKDTTYEDLCGVYNWCIIRHRLVLKEEIEKYDYSSTFKVDDSGNLAVDYSSGHILTIPWPDSGLCPFCLSAQELRTYTKRNGPRPKERIPGSRNSRRA